MHDVTSAPALRLHVRWMIRRDMPEVLAIEHASFASPWTEEDFLAQLRNQSVIGMVVEDWTGCEGVSGAGPVVGSMVSGLEKRYLAVVTLAVAPSTGAAAWGPRWCLSS